MTLDEEPKLTIENNQDLPGITTSSSSTKTTTTTTATYLPLGHWQSPPDTSGDPGSLVPGPQSSSPFVTSTSEQDLLQKKIDSCLPKSKYNKRNLLTPEFVFSSPLGGLAFQLYITVVANHILE